jgi:heme-degrading monooxygenase HmoA
MYCVAFIWEPGDYDAEFHRLNAAIESLANAMPGFLGAEPWESADRTRRCVNYYWSDLETLKRFSDHPTHQEAKRQYKRWYKGYHIVVSEVIRSYGDNAFPHITASADEREAG